MKPDIDEPDHEPHIERMIDRADYLRTERKDREWEQCRRGAPLRNQRKETNQMETSTNAVPPVVLARLVRRLDSLVTLGVPVPVKIAGLKKLATMGEIGERIFRKCVEVLEVTTKKRQYWPLMDLLMVERAIAEQCFPAAESTVPEHMRNAPEWLTESETILPPNAEVSHGNRELQPDTNQTHKSP